MLKFLAEKQLTLREAKKSPVDMQEQRLLNKNKLESMFNRNVSSKICKTFTHMYLLNDQ